MLMVMSTPGQTQGAEQTDSWWEYSTSMGSVNETMNDWSLVQFLGNDYNVTLSYVNYNYTLDSTMVKVNQTWYYHNDTGILLGNDQTVEYSNKTGILRIDIAQFRYTLLDLVNGSMVNFQARSWCLSDKITTPLGVWNMTLVIIQVEPSTFEIVDKAEIVNTTHFVALSNYSRLYNVVDNTTIDPGQRQYSGHLSDSIGRIVEHKLERPITPGLGLNSGPDQLKYMTDYYIVPGPGIIDHSSEKEGPYMNLLSITTILIIISLSKKYNRH